MDSWAWVKINEGVSELGCGPVKFVFKDDEDTLLEVDEVLVTDDEITVVLV